MRREIGASVRIVAEPEKGYQERANHKDSGRTACV